MQNMTMHQRFIIKGKVSETKVYIEPWEKVLSSLTENENTIVITDTNLYHFYSEFLKSYKVIQINPGEKSKDLNYLESIYTELLDLGIDRSSLIVGFGGGVVTDIAGFIAATFMRGLRVGFVSTSLLGQVDAVIGGKNGVNLKGYKNIVVTFYNPQFIISDPSFFDTLPEKEYINGSAEVVKQFLIADEASFHWFADNLEKFKRKDTEFLFDLIHRQSRIKANVVQKDEKETGIRKILNFGHSFGHAIEKSDQSPHGFAVSPGMAIAIRISKYLDLLKKEEAERALMLLDAVGLPTHPEKELRHYLPYLKMDKKKQGDFLDFILLEKIGKAKIHPFTFKELSELANKLSL